MYVRTTRDMNSTLGLVVPLAMFIHLLAPAALISTELDHLGLDVGHLLVDVLDGLHVVRGGLPIRLHLPAHHVDRLPQTVDAPLRLLDALAVVHDGHLASSKFSCSDRGPKFGTFLNGKSPKFGSPKFQVPKLGPLSEAL